MTDSIALVQTFLRAENQRAWHQWAALLHPNVTYTVVGSSRPIHGRDQYVAHMQQVYEELADWHFELVHIVGDADAVMVEFAGHGHFTGTHQGQPYTDVSLNLMAVCVFELRDGLIHNVREYVDTLGYAHQLQNPGQQHTD